MQKIVHYDDIFFTMVADCEDENPVWINLKVYSSRGSDSSTGYLYNVRNYVYGMDYTENIEEAQIYLSGSIKWGGCSNINLGIDQQKCLHFCSKQKAKNIGTLLGRIYDLAAEMMPRHSKNILKKVVDNNYAERS